MTAPHIYRFFSNYVFKHCGIQYKENDYYRLDSRFNALVKHYQLKDTNELFDKYSKLITPEMHSKLIDLCTNNETYFMRDLKPFKGLAKEGMALLRENFGAGTTFNIWSAACSTGQEPLSILMALESFGENESLSKFQLEASDISTQALARAKKGLYSGLEVQRGLPASLLVQYFDQVEEDWQVHSSLLNKIRFKSFNLLTDTFTRESYHVIFCRNVLIYQALDNKKMIIKKIAESLKPGGLLFMGAGESLIGMDIPLKQIQIGKAYCYYKNP